MGDRLLWLLALVVTFVVGLAAGGAVRTTPSASPEVDRLRGTVSRLEQQVSTLQARLRARESAPGARPPGPTAYGDSRQLYTGAGPRPADRIAAGAVGQERPSADRVAGDTDARAPQAESQAEGASSRAARATAVTPPTVEPALDRFYKYLEATSGAEGRERWQRARELVDDLRAMGDAGAQALMHVLATGTNSDERRAAARLLGTLQTPQAVPVLRDIIEREDDLLLRRAAAAGLRRLHTPESVPVMERILTNPTEDRFVRLSAAYGLAESGRPLGVTGLAQIFEESTADGRGRELAFRALASLKDERPLPFMRQLVTSPAEPAYRLQAIRYLTAQGDRQALVALQLVTHSPHEQPSIRDAAAQAHAAISGR
ncbi:MAG: HEAT repeat domain-containing protein [Candidatus Rokuibacteriota bacterium]